MRVDIHDLFWKASIKELKQGYLYNNDAEEYICLLCGRGFLKGVIYSREKVYYEAEKYISLHTREEHCSVFDVLSQLGKSLS